MNPAMSSPAPKAITAAPVILIRFALCRLHSFAIADRSPLYLCGPKSASEGSSYIGVPVMNSWLQRLLQGAFERMTTIPMCLRLVGTSCKQLAEYPGVEKVVTRGLERRSDGGLIRYRMRSPRGVQSIDSSFP